MNHEPHYEIENMVPSHKKEEREKENMIPSKKDNHTFWTRGWSLQVLQLHYVTTEYSASEGQRIGFRKAPIH